MSTSGYLVAGLAKQMLAPGVAGAVYWQAAVFGAIYLSLSILVFFHLLSHPALFRRRLRGGPLAEPEPRQRVIITLTLLGVLALFVISVLDYERGWSRIPVPVPVVLLGDLMVAGGLVLIWVVFRANPYAAATVQVEPEQTVIASGPYALVRHPMYTGTLLLFLGAPVALGSWWGLILFLPILVLIILRLQHEERYLSSHLSGYRDYCVRVKHRLVPALW